MQIQLSHSIWISIKLNFMQSTAPLFFSLMHNICFYEVILLVNRMWRKLIECGFYLRFVLFVRALKIDKWFFWSHFPLKREMEELYCYNKGCGNKFKASENKEGAHIIFLLIKLKIYRTCHRLTQPYSPISRLSLLSGFM